MRNSRFSVGDSGPSRHSRDALCLPLRFEAELLPGPSDRFVEAGDDLARLEVVLPGDSFVVQVHVDELGMVRCF